MVKSTISKDEVKHIAKLARLGLSENELEKMQREFAAILDYINLLKEADVSRIEATFHSVPLENVMRDDEAKEESIEVINNMLEQAPVKEKGYIRVKGIL